MEHSFKYRLAHYVTTVFAFSLIAISCTKPLEVDVPEFTESNTGPYIMNIDHLEFVKAHLDSFPVISQDYNELLSGTDDLLMQEFMYVTDKKKLPPSGNIHDYLSLSRYAWPDSAGVYSDQRDGKTNPEIYDYDRPKLAKLSSAVYSLALAYYFSGKEKYAEKATELIRGWFLEPSTKMNPNMNHAQIAFGVNTGSAQGIIDGNDFIYVIEAVSLLYDSHHWTKNDHVELKHWFHKFIDWIVRNYNPDAYGTVNISTWLDTQRAIYYLFVEEEYKLNSNLHIRPIDERIQIQFSPEGIQPNEINRVRSQHYVYFNLRAYMNLSLLRKNRGAIDRDWSVLNTPKYGGLKPGIDFLVSVMNGESMPSQFEHESDFDTCRYLEIFKPASIAFESPEYARAAQQLIEQGCSNPNITLVFPDLASIDSDFNQ